VVQRLFELADCVCAVDVVEISLAEMTKAVVMLGNSQLRAEMDSIDPVNTGQLPQTIMVVRACLLS
jgi:hypothetical protein